MFRKMLRAKIHRATVTEANVDYEGSITIDAALMEAADIYPGEAVSVVDVTNGARVETYAIPGPEGSGVICANGAAAHLIHKGDLVIIMAYAYVLDADARGFAAHHVYVDERNRIVKAERTVPGESYAGASRARS
jgi:aspartate 1-decarboxylase